MVRFLGGLLLLLQGCASFFSPQDDAESYFFDALNCYNSTIVKEQVNIPLASGITVIELPLSPDAGAFKNCMVETGHPPPKGDAGEFLKIAHQCLKAAHKASDPDSTYADCVRRSEIAIEPVLPVRAK